MKFGKWHILFWMPPSTWGFNWGMWPNKRCPEFFFVNVAFIEVRMSITLEEKKCKKCGQEIGE